MLVAVSPYHLTTREPPAMAALLLAERVVTMIPSPRTGVGHAALRRAIERSPQYLRFMQSWEWSLPLWRAGVVASALGDDDPSNDMLDACERIDSDPALEALRPLMRPDLLENDERYLDALSRDILRAGPDPCFSVPVAAGLDRFAARTGAMVARPEPVSVAQRAEAGAARPVAAVAVPVLLQAGGEVILRAREALAPSLGALRRALALEARADVERSDPRDRGTPGSARAACTALAAPLRAAAARYTEDFERAAPSLSSGRDEARVLSGHVVIQASAMNQDAVLRASLSAVRVLHGRAVRERSAPVAEASEQNVVSLFVRTIGTGGAGRRTSS